VRELLWCSDRHATEARKSGRRRTDGPRNIRRHIIAGVRRCRHRHDAQAEQDERDDEEEKARPVEAKDAGCSQP
jgi:hypothetical protein